MQNHTSEGDDVGPGQQGFERNARFGKRRIGSLLTVENADDGDDLAVRILMDAFHRENG